MPPSDHEESGEEPATDDSTRSEDARVSSAGEAAGLPELEVVSDDALLEGVGEEFDLATEVDPLIGTIVAERYRVLDLIGVGGMGAVYRAKHVHMRKVVALKVLHREMTVLPEVVKRFEREAVAAGRISHPNVAQATDSGRLADGAFFIVLEYVEGQSLAELVSQERFTVERAARVGRQVALALDAAHSAGVVHRDLKPDNVLLAPDTDGRDLVKVLDFGIAKVDMRDVGASDQPITQIGTVFGTPEYMSPEQAAGQPVDHRADIYCLGLLFYRMLAGRPPFRSEGVRALLAMQITQPPPPLPQNVQPRVVSIVMRLLEKEPENRYQSAAEVAADLQEFLDHPTAVSEAPKGRFSVDAEVTTASGAALYAGSTDAGSRRYESGRFPLGGVALAVCVAGLVFWGATRFFFGEASSASAPPASVRATPTEITASVDPQVESLLARAFAGDREAIGELEKRPAEARTAREWVALARGWSKVGESKRALEAYREALSKDDKIGTDPNIARAVRAAANDPETAGDALHIAAEYLGEVGADILYDVWVRRSERTPTTELAEELVRGERVRARASPALEAALALRTATTCAEFEKLLPVAALHADRRSTRLLTPLRKRDDCEFQPAMLEAAISAARERPAPGF